MVPFFEFLCFATPSPIELHGLRDKKFLFGSEQAEKSVLYTALKSTMTYGIFRFSLRFENRMVTLKHKYKISIRVSNRDIYKNWCIFVKFGRRSPIQPDWYFINSRLWLGSQDRSGSHPRKGWGMNPE
jgi:hypothetical protein